MPLIRFSLDLAIPEVVYQAIPSAQKQAFRVAVLAMKALSVKINAGQGNEENTMKAQYHICRHDSGGSCDSEVDI